MSRDNGLSQLVMTLHIYNVFSHWLKPLSRGLILRVGVIQGESSSGILQGAVLSPVNF